MAEDEDDDIEAPGWDAIDAALRPIYGTREPLHYGTALSYMFGGPDPIHGISVYKNRNPAHWHYVTFGFSELWAKESADAEVSGYGFELTFRPTCQARDKEPPNWAWNFLQNLGRYVFETGRCFGVGHTLPLNGPIEQGSSTLIHAVSFIHDPQLPPMDTPNGRVEFFQVVGLTMDELAAISSWNAEAFLELRGREEPLLVTDLGRSSWLEEPSFAAKVTRRTRAEGSSCGWLSLALKCDTKVMPIRVKLQSIAVEGFARRLMGRLPFARELTLNGKRATVIFKPGKRAALKVAEDAVIITLRDEQAAELCASLQPRAGTYPIPGLKNVVLRVLKTRIKDQDGNVTEVVG